MADCMVHFPKMFIFFFKRRRRKEEEERKLPPPPPPLPVSKVQTLVGGIIQVDTPLAPVIFQTYYFMRESYKLHE